MLSGDGVDLLAMIGRCGSHTMVWVHGPDLPHGAGMGRRCPSWLALRGATRASPSLSSSLQAPTGSLRIVFAFA